MNFALSKWLELSGVCVCVCLAVGDNSIIVVALEGASVLSREILGWETLSFTHKKSMLQ